MPLPDEIWVHFKTLSWTVLKFPLCVRNFFHVTCLSARPNFHLTSSNPFNQIMGLALKLITTSTFTTTLQFATRIYFPTALWPKAGHGLIIEVSRSHTTIHHNRQDSSGWVISPLQGPLIDITLHLRQTYRTLVGFESTISAGERPQTYALDSEVSKTGTRHIVCLCIVDSRHSESVWIQRDALLFSLYTKCRLFSASWRWASNARNM
jgi:hypothetical protein